MRTGRSNARVLIESVHEADEYDESVSFDPLTVVIDRPWQDDLILNAVLIDGFDRYAAYEATLDPESLVWVEVIQVSREQPLERTALFLAAAANTTNKHQTPRTRDDKRKAVATLLKDEEWVKYSDRAIASYLKVSHPFVSQYRKELEERSLILPVASRTSSNQKQFAQVEINIEEAQARLSQVQSLLDQVKPKEVQQVIDLAWEIQQDQGGGLVSPESYKEAIRRLKCGEVINRTEDGSWARARSEKKLLTTIQGARDHVSLEGRAKALRALFPTREELAAATELAFQEDLVLV